MTWKWVISSVLYGDAEGFLWVIDSASSCLFQGSILTIIRLIIFSFVKSESEANRAGAEIFFSRFNLCAHTTCSSEESGRSLRDQRAGWLYFAWVLYWKYSIKLSISEHIACTRCSHPREPFPFLPGAFYCGQCFLRDFRIDSQQCLQPISSFSSPLWSSLSILTASFANALC